MGTQFVGMLLVVLLILTVLFLLAREFMCWYWKVNETLSVLQSIVSSLDMMRKQLAAGAALPRPATATIVPTVRKCSKCGSELPAANKYCETCGTRN